MKIGLEVFVQHFQTLQHQYFITQTGLDIFHRLPVLLLLEKGAFAENLGIPLCCPIKISILLFCVCLDVKNMIEGRYHYMQRKGYRQHFTETDAKSQMLYPQKKI